MAKINYQLIVALPVLAACLAVFIVLQKEAASPAANTNANININANVNGNINTGLNVPNGPDVPETVDPEENIIPTSSPNLYLFNFTSGSKVKSPLTLRGIAAGWYFEGSFPVKLLDANGVVLAEAPARSNSDWMTTDYVDFVLDLSFDQPKTLTGTLILKNDNPSGDPSRDEIVEIPITFAAASAACKPTGCSGQICSYENTISTCEYLPQYACYKTARCERQNDGKCGWTQTPELAACLAK